MCFKTSQKLAFKRCTWSDFNVGNSSSKICRPANIFVRRIFSSGGYFRPVNVVQVTGDGVRVVQVERMNDLDTLNSGPEWSFSNERTFLTGNKTENKLCLNDVTQKQYLRRRTFMETNTLCFQAYDFYLKFSLNDFPGKVRKSGQNDPS